jgi:NADH dehydrogenase
MSESNETFSQSLSAAPPAVRGQVLVLGGGYAGLRCATALAGHPGFAVTLVDRERRRVDKTRLHEAVGAGRGLDLRRLLARTPVRFVQAEVLGLDRRSKRVTTDAGTLPYDTLVFALGGIASDGGVRGVREHALVFDGTRDARRFLAALATLRHSGQRLVVVGAGPTGVEAAAEAARVLEPGRVVLVDVGSRLLPSAPASVAAYASFMLRRAGVRMRLGTRIVEVDEDAVVVAGGERIAGGAVLWCGGVRPSLLLAESYLAGADRPADVDPYLVSKVDESVYVIGDNVAAAGGPGGRPSAQVAVQQGDFVAADLIARATGAPRRGFAASLVGTFTSLGPSDAVGALHLGGFDLPLFGPLAWALKEAGGWRHALVVQARRLPLAFANGRERARRLRRREEARMREPLVVPVEAA